MKKYLAVAAAAALTAGTVAPSSAWAVREHIWAAGSSTVFPFATRVAENFQRNRGSGAAPRVESLGTGGGIQLFCRGMGEAFPDIATASRPMKKSEFDACQRNGVRNIVAIKVGFDGIVIATDKDGADYNFRLEHLFLGLSAQVLRGGQWVRNPYNTWDQIGQGLPGNRIQVYGPPPSSGTRDAWVELAIEAGARRFPTADAIRSDNEKRFKTLVDPMRSDGWIDAGENDNAIVQTLQRTPGSLGVFGFSYLEQNRDQLKAASVNGVRPSVQTIADGSYPLSRSLFIYVKKDMVGVTPGLQEYVNEFVSDAASGRGGYLQTRGLIPLPPGQHAAQQGIARAMTPMTRPAS